MPEFIYNYIELRAKCEGAKCRAQSVGAQRVKAQK